MKIGNLFQLKTILTFCTWVSLFYVIRCPGMYMKHMSNKPCYMYAQPCTMPLHCNTLHQSVQVSVEILPGTIWNQPLIPACHRNIVIFWRYRCFWEYFANYPPLSWNPAGTLDVNEGWNQALYWPWLNATGVHLRYLVSRQEHLNTDDF